MPRVSSRPSSASRRASTSVARKLTAQPGRRSGGSVPCLPAGARRALSMGARRYRASIRDILHDSDVMAHEEAERIVSDVLAANGGRMPRWSGASLRRMPALLELWRNVANVSADRLPYLCGVPSTVISHVARGERPNGVGAREWNRQLAEIAAALALFCPSAVRRWMSGCKVTAAEAAFARGIVVERCASGIRGASVRSLQDAALVLWCQRWAKRRGCVDRSDVVESPRALKPGEYVLGKVLDLQAPMGTLRRTRIDFAVRLPERGARLLLLDTRSAGDPTNMTKRIKEIAPIARRVRKQYRNTSFAVVVGGFLSEANLAHMADERLPYAWHGSPLDLDRLAKPRSLAAR